MTIKAVLFDIDGTLVDSNDMHVTAWAEAFATVGASFDRQVIHDQVGKGGDLLVPALMPQLDEDTCKQVAEAHGKAFKSRFLDAVRPFPGARDLLARVHAAGAKVVLASSASGAELDHYVDLLDARDLIAETVSGDEVETTKPAPDIFARALEKVAPFSAAEVVAVGDTPYDVEAAGQCGVATIALRSGKFAEAWLREAGAVAVYDDAAALLGDYDGSPLAG